MEQEAPPSRVNGEISERRRDVMRFFNLKKFANILFYKLLYLEECVDGWNNAITIETYSHTGLVTLLLAEAIIQPFCFSYVFTFRCYEPLLPCVIV